MVNLGDFGRNRFKGYHEILTSDNTFCTNAKLVRWRSFQHCSICAVICRSVQVLAASGKFDCKFLCSVPKPNLVIRHQGHGNVSTNLDPSWAIDKDSNQTLKLCHFQIKPYGVTIRYNRLEETIITNSHSIGFVGTYRRKLGKCTIHSPSRAVFYQCLVPLC